MKQFTHIVLDDKGLKTIVAPDRNSFFGFNNKERYEEALQQAIADGVYFNLNVGMQNIWHHKYEKGKLYPIPDGYEVKIVTTHELYSDNIDEQYATLVPKENPESLWSKMENINDSTRAQVTERGAGDDYPVIDLTKNPELLHSYEQLYSTSKGDVGKVVDFGNGACGILLPKQKSIEEASKEYWFKLMDEFLESDHADPVYAKEGINGFKEWYESFKKKS